MFPYLPVRASLSFSLAALCICALVMVCPGVLVDLPRSLSSSSSGSARASAAAFFAFFFVVVVVVVGLGYPGLPSPDAC